MIFGNLESLYLFEKLFIDFFSSFETMLEILKHFDNFWLLFGTLVRIVPLFFLEGFWAWGVFDCLGIEIFAWQWLVDLLYFLAVLIFDGGEEGVRPLLRRYSKRQVVFVFKGSVCIIQCAFTRFSEVFSDDKIIFSDLSYKFRHHF